MKNTTTTQGDTAKIERPAAAPREGQIEAFDAGWNAHETGLERESVRVFTPPTGQGWALLGWDMRETLSRGESKKPAPCVHEWEYDETESAATGAWSGHIERCKRCGVLQQVPK